MTLSHAHSLKPLSPDWQRLDAALVELRAAIECELPESLDPKLRMGFYRFAKDANGLHVKAAELHRLLSAEFARLNLPTSRKG